LSDENGNGPYPTPKDTDGDSEEEVCEEEIEPVEIVFSDGKGYVDKDNSDKISQQGFYGTRLDDGRLELIPVEILHLLERRRIVAKTPDGAVVAADYVVNSLLSASPSLWTDYLVFRDLRSRGYAVRQGFGAGLGFRVYARGDKPGTANANQLVYVLREGAPISLHDLDMVTEAALAARKKLVFALVDQNGEVNFYRVAQAVLENRAGDDD
jgi:tRNA-intron endonuclease